MFLLTTVTPVPSSVWNLVDPGCLFVVFFFLICKKKMCPAGERGHLRLRRKERGKMSFQPLSEGERGWTTGFSTDFYNQYIAFILPTYTRIRTDTHIYIILPFPTSNYYIFRSGKALFCSYYVLFSPEFLISLKQPIRVVSPISQDPTHLLKFSFKKRF